MFPKTYFTLWYFTPWYFPEESTTQTVRVSPSCILDYNEEEIVLVTSEYEAEKMPLAVSTGPYTGTKDWTI